MKKILLISAAIVVVAGLGWTGRAMYRAHKNIVSIDAYNTPLADVVKQLQRQTREPILLGKDLQAKVTLSVKDVPLTEALDKLSQAAGLNWSKWHAVHDSKPALDRLETALRNRTKIDEVGWTNVAPRELPGGPSWVTGGPPGDGGGDVVEIKRKPVVVTMNSNDKKSPAEMEAAIREQLKAQGLNPTEVKVGGSMPVTEDVDVDVKGPRVGKSMMMSSSGGGKPQIRMVTRTRDGAGNVVEEIWSPEHVVLEQKLQSKLGDKSYSDASEATAREVAEKVKGDLTTLYVLSRAPGGMPFAANRMRKFNVGEGGGTNSVPGQPPPMPNIEAAVQRAEAENYTRLTPEQRVQRARDKQAAKTKQ